MGKQIGEGREDRRKKEREKRRNAAARKENCTKTRRCVVQLAGRDEGEKYPGGEIPDGRVCVHLYVHRMRVSRLRRRDKEVAGSEWHAKEKRRCTRRRG